jgi:hypothetical protein
MRYLIALAAREHAALVSGDRHLLELAAELPIYTPAESLSPRSVAATAATLLSSTRRPAAR